MALTQVSPGLLDSQAAAPTFRNRIINGAMMIDQRNAGAEVNPAVNNTYYLDRWSVLSTQTSKFKIGQNAGAVTPPTSYINYLGITSLSAYSVVSSDVFEVRQNIEGLNVSDLAWGTASAQTVTLSFWVRSSLTGTFGGAFQNSAYNYSYPFTFPISSADTWEQKTITVVGPTSGTWLTTNGIGLRVVFGLGVGSTYSGTAGAWAATEYHSATGATSVVGTNGATFYITGVQLEKGSVATPFEHRLYGTELALCQRYYWRVNQFETVSNGTAYSSTTVYTVINYPTTMRASPSFSYSSLSDFGLYSAGLPRTVSAVGVSSYSSVNAADISLTTSGLTAGWGAWLRCLNNSGAYMDFSSEL